MGFLSEAIEFIDRYNGVLLFLATLLLAYVTWRLARESIAARTSAGVVLTAGIWEYNESVAVFRLINHGPAVARLVKVTFDWFEKNGSPMPGVPRHTVALPVIGPGESRSYAPDTLIAALDGGAILSIESLASAGWRLSARYEWQDDRKGTLGFGNATHRGDLEVAFTDFRDSVHGPPNMIDPPPPAVGGTTIPGVAGRTPRQRNR